MNCCIGDFKHSLCDCESEFYQKYKGIGRAEDFIKKVMTANLERKSGKWIDYTEDGFVECPFCHSATNCDGDIANLHFCFFCGAKMEQADPQTVTGLDGTVYVQDEDKQGWTGHQMMRGEEDGNTD